MPFPVLSLGMRETVGPLDTRTTYIRGEFRWFSAQSPDHKPAMMIMYSLCAVLLSLAFMRTSKAHEVTVEFDELTLTNCRLRNRADASNKKTVALYNTESLTYDLCLTKEKTFRMDKMRYSNDGLKDLITISVNDREIGRVETRELAGNGELWNNILEVVNIGVERRLAAGNYSLTVTADHADLYGVELDSLTFSLDGTSPDDNSQCTATQGDTSAALLVGCFPGNLFFNIMIMM